MFKPITLARYNLFTLCNQGRITIFCAQGQLWITVPNDQLDYILHTGMSISVETRGACVIEALQSATLTLDPEPLESIATSSPVEERALAPSITKLAKRLKLFLSSQQIEKG